MSLVRNQEDLYPEAVFVWENYLLACGQCNSGKNKHFSVIRHNRLVDVTRRRGDPIRTPRSGPPAAISPRNENPLTFLDLEIVDTFLFLPRVDLSAIDEHRAEYTIDVLKLNREVLLTVRRGAYSEYRARLYEYRGLRNDGASEADLRDLRIAIESSDHPTVWREMQRQQSLVDELRALFLDVPEAVDW